MKSLQAIEHRLRSLIETPLLDRPWYTWPLMPLQALIACLFALIAGFRRGFFSGRAHASNDLTPWVVCVGNVAAGGTGKSPIVRMLASEFLAKGYVTAIMARGINAPRSSPHLNNVAQKGLLVFQASSALTSQEKFSALSDENREHAWLLANKGNLFILQGGARSRLLSLFSDQLRILGLDPALAVVVMDDGLHHFSCPRHIDLCVWSPTTLLRAPAVSLPLGPYREGFFVDFPQTLDRGALRLWSRVSAQSGDAGFQTFQQNCRLALARFGRFPDDSRDLVVHSTFVVRAVKSDTHAPFGCAFGPNLQPGNVWQELTGVDGTCTSPDNVEISWALLSGIAAPERFVADVAEFFSDQAFGQPSIIYHAGDHAGLPSHIVQALQSTKALVLTAKDFFRWWSVPEVKALMESRLTLVCFIETGVKTYAGKEICLMDALVPLLSAPDFGGSARQ